MNRALTLILTPSLMYKLTLTCTVPITLSVALICLALHFGPPPHATNRCRDGMLQVATTGYERNVKRDPPFRICTSTVRVALVSFRQQH